MTAVCHFNFPLFMSSKKLIALITINWKRYDLTKKLFISLQNSTVKPDTYLVDNECDASKVADVAPYCREVFKFRENTGYSFANNHAAKKIGRNYEYLLFINNDTLVEPETIEIMLDYAKKLPQHSILHPLNLKYDEPNIITSAGSLNILGPGVGYRFESAKLSKVKSRLKPVMKQNYLHGACFLINSKDFLDVGGFDERFYIYHEDNDLGRKLKKKFNSTFYCVTEAVIYHKHHGSEPFHKERHWYYTIRSIALYLTDNNKYKKAFIRFICRLANLLLWPFKTDSNIKAVRTGLRDYLEGNFGRSEIYR